MKNIVNGEECCFRCGESKKDIKKEKIICSHWGTSYKKHLFTS